MPTETNNKLIIISSPSGAGKTTLCKLLIKKMKISTFQSPIHLEIKNLMKFTAKTILLVKKNLKN